MLRLRPTYEQVLKETMTHRLKILPEKQKRTQQGILLDDVDFDDFDLNKYDRKEILMNNPDKGTQTDLFETEKSESMKSVEKDYTPSEEVESEPVKEREPDRDRETERERGKSVMRRLYDTMFGNDEYREERDELEEMRNKIEEEEQEEEQEEQEEEDDDEGLSMDVKKSYEPSSSSSTRSSTNRSALLPIEEEALSEHIQSSPPVSVQSSVPTNRTIEYVEGASADASRSIRGSPAQSVISSRRSQETIEYIRSRSSRNIKF